MKKFIFFLFCIFVPFTFLFSQNKPSREELKEKSFIISIPEGYIDSIYEPRTFVDNRVLECAMHYPKAIKSKDRDVIIYFHLYPEEDLGGYNTPHPDEMYRYLISNDLGWILKKSHFSIKKDDWKSVNYYPPLYAKRVFNADTVVSYHFWPKEAPALYREKYIGSQSIVGQKNGKGYFQILFFYTKKEKEDLDKYIKEIEGVIRFRED